MSNDLAITGESALAIPQHLAKYASQTAGDDFGKLTQADFGIGMLKICQGTSREIAPGPSGEPAIPMGTVFNKRDRKILPIGTLWIPLCRSVKYIRWDGKPGEGRMLFQTNDEHDPRIKECRGLEFRKDRDGKTISPLVTTYTNFYVYVQGFAEPVLLSFCRAAAPIGRRLTQDLFRFTQGNKLPMWTCMFAVMPSVLRTEPGKQWYEFAYKFNGLLPATTAEETFTRIRTMYETAIMLRDASTGEEFAQAEDAEEPVQHNSTLMDTQAGNPDLKNVTPAAPVQQAPAFVPPSVPAQQAPAFTPPAVPAQQPITQAPAQQAQDICKLF